MSRFTSGFFFWGGGGGAQEFDPLPTPKGHPTFCTILKYPFLVTDPTVFLNLPSAPFILNLKGERTPKKRNFLVKTFQKLSENAFFAPFFSSKFCLGRRIFGKYGVLIVI